MIILYFLLFIVFSLSSSVISADDPQFLKSGASITNSAAADVLLTFNQIDESQFPLISSFVAVVDGDGNPVTGLTKSNFVDGG